MAKDLPPTRDFARALAKGKFHLIAEIKKASPSAGVIRKDFNPIYLAKVYEESGACAISVLTNKKLFQGRLDHIKLAKESTTVPILRKDFILEESQIYESRLAGADALLLIARRLNQSKLENLMKLTKEQGMSALVEVHSEEEAQRALELDAPIIGINNRDLDTLEVDLQTTLRIMKNVPQLKEKIIISESGIKTAADVKSLKEAGADGILVGEAILRSSDITGKIRELLG